MIVCRNPCTPDSDEYPSQNSWRTDCQSYCNFRNMAMRNPNAWWLLEMEMEQGHARQWQLSQLELGLLPWEDAKLLLHPSDVLRVTEQAAAAVVLPSRLVVGVRSALAASASTKLSEILGFPSAVQPYPRNTFEPLESQQRGFPHGHRSAAQPASLSS